MEFGICLQSVIPVRSEPSHRAEMVTQVLFGELYRVIDHDQNWLRVRLAYDDYEGWISFSQSELIGEAEFVRLFGEETPVATGLVQLISNETMQSVIPILPGSSLPGLRENQFRIGENIYLFEGQTADQGILDRASTPQEMQQALRHILSNAMLYQHAPYLWGGRSPFGIDCSGFVQMVFKLCKVKLLRDASQQAAQGESVSLLAEAEPCDIAFFDDEEGNITHTGLLIDRTRIIHCHGKVRIDAIDHEGIYNSDLQKYTHKLRLIKRVI
jgi:hypothetical protein